MVGNVNKPDVREGLLTAGLDVGARSVKIAILSHQEARPVVVAEGLVRTEEHPIREGWNRVLAEAGLSAGDIDYVVSTGTRDHEAVDALGARLLFPDAIAALDVGTSQIRCVVFDERSIGRGTTLARVAGGCDSETSDAIARGSATNATIEESAR